MQSTVLIHKIELRNRHSSATTYLVNQPVIDHGAAYLLEELVQRLDLAHADCTQITLHVTG